MMDGDALSDVSDRLKARWAGMGSRMGLGFAAAGFFIIVLAWNGAAGVDFTQGQIPYLLSGGAVGIGLIVVGAAVIVSESFRRDRQHLEAKLEELSLAVTKLSSTATAAAAPPGSPEAELVVVGRRSFHDPSCRLATGKNPEEMTRVAALDQGFEPCRVCQGDD